MKLFTNGFQKTAREEDQEFTIVVGIDPSTNDLVRIPLCLLARDHLHGLGRVSTGVSVPGRQTPATSDAGIPV